MKKPFSVSELNNYIQALMQNDFVLKNVYVKGELSSCKQSGNVFYCDLKDDNSIIKINIFDSVLKNITFEIKDGLFVDVRGSVQVYKKRGSYSIIVNTMEKSGIGKIYEEYEALKKALEESGMFDYIYKKKIPLYPMKVGIVTSKDGAAIEDMRNVISRNNPYIEITLYPSLVQGDKAPQSIIKGINKLDELNLDVIIVGRGGGSFEDLNCFNDKELAYTIFNANTPIISAVGHQIDYTITDFVADIRAQTPTEAASLVAWNVDDYFLKLNEKREEYKQLLETKINEKTIELEETLLLLYDSSPMNKIEEYKNKIEQIRINLKNEIKNKFINIKLDINHTIDLLEALSPLQKLKSGYAYVENKYSKKISSIKDIKEGEVIKAYIKDGSFESKIIQKEEKTWQNKK
ncbi:MAG: exodeoxyribonuclease VII large subunit [Eubacteriales bacterium]|nr:exodeoxyribonuclease VII large subunit [Eubacteriales bacterium]